ncbi:MAG: M20/M25/M40 family metallo-hydrolase [Chloroflexota bacterium]
MPRRIYLLLCLILLLGVSCSLLEEPERPVIPTPITTAIPLGEQLTASQDTVFDPVSGVVPAVDPQIARLLNEVSQQTLFAYVQQLENFGTRHTFSPTDRADYGIGAAREWIFNQFVQVGSGRLRVEYDTFQATVQGRITEQQNVVATLPGNGTYPGVIVLMAHYDSRTVDPFDGSSFAPGANDNASGVALMLETARLLSAYEWSQTIVFVATAGEEQQTIGSRYFATSRMLNGWLIDAAFNFDIVGGRPGVPQFVRVFADGDSAGQHMHMARYINYIGGLYLPTFGTSIVNSPDREGRYGDQREFVAVGVPAVRITESIEDVDLQHNARDRADRLDYGYLAQVTRLAVITTANLIGAPAVPPAPTISPMAEPGSYLLAWATDPQAAGYAISFRPVGTSSLPPLRFVSSRDAGNIALTGFDPDVTYAVSMAALDENGRLGLFTQEVIVNP